MSHTEGTFSAHDGLTLYTQTWLPEVAPVARLAVAHGLGEHSGRYANFAAWFTPRGFAVHALDHRGHGQSPGQRGHINAWAEFRDDLHCFLDQMPTDVPVFLVGHSMGGLIVLDYGLHYPTERLRGVVASAPGLAPGGGVSKATIAGAKVLSRIMPKLQMPNGLDVQGLARDPEVIRAYLADPLVHGHATPRFAVEMLATGLWTRVHAADWPSETPLLLMHGAADPICRPEATAQFFADAGARDKVYIPYPNCLHEIFNEVEWEKVLADLEEWLRARL